MSWTLELELPSYAVSNADVRASYRSVVGQSARRGMERISGRAASATPFPRVSGAYRVAQTSEGGLIAFGIFNDSAIFPFIEDDVAAHFIGPHFPPIAPLQKWAVAHGFPPEAAWGIAVNISKRGMRHPGSKGKHYLQRAFDAGANDLMNTLDAAVARWLGRLGDV